MKSEWMCKINSEPNSEGFPENWSLAHCNWLKQKTVIYPRIYLNIDNVNNERQTTEGLIVVSNL